MSRIVNLKRDLSAVTPGGIEFERVGAGEWRIREDDRCIGDVNRYEDITEPGTHVFVIHLDEDSRGPRRVKERDRVREETLRLVDTHPLW